MLNVNWEKIHSIILSVTCHGLRNFASAHTHPLISIREFSRPYELLFSELVTHKMLNVNWEKIHSIILSVTCHGLRNCPPLYTSPQNHSWIFDTLRVIYFELRVTHKMLNVNCMKIHSIILSLTCHSLRNFLPLTHIPLYPLMNFWNPMGWSGSYMGGVG